VILYYFIDFLQRKFGVNIVRKYVRNMHSLSRPCMKICAAVSEAIFVVQVAPLAFNLFAFLHAVIFGIQFLCSRRMDRIYSHTETAQLYLYEVNKYVTNGYRT
jgi:hypothetical protein